MSELIDCVDGLTAEDIIRSIAKTGNGMPFYLQSLGGVSFLPTDLPNLAFWLRSDLGITTNVFGPDTVVNQWVDQSAGGAIFAQAVDADKPKYLLNTINGHPAVDFDGVSEWMLQTVGGQSFDPYTLFLVCEVGANFIFGSSDNQRDNVTINNISIFVRTSGAALTFAFPINLNVQVCEVVDDSANIRAYKNGVEAPLGAQVSNAPLDFDQLFQYRTASGFGDGWLAEAVIYNAVMTPAQRALVLAYLQTRYAI